MESKNILSIYKEVNECRWEELVLGRPLPGTRGPQKEKSEDHSSESQLMVLGEVWVHFVHACVLSRFSHVGLFATLWTVFCQAPLSMGFSGQECWSGSPWPPPGDLPGPGIAPTSLSSPALAGRCFTTITTWEAPYLVHTSENVTGLPTHTEQ